MAHRGARAADRDGILPHRPAQDHLRRRDRGDVQPLRGALQGPPGRGEHPRGGDRDRRALRQGGGKGAEADAAARDPPRHRQSPRHRPPPGRVLQPRKINQGRGAEGRDVEVRLSTLPTAFGEKLVMRVFDPEVIVKDFAELGFSEDDKGRWKQMIEQPNGIILVTGPTGSGKTTTLYSTLKTI